MATSDTLARTNFVLAAVRDRLGTPAEGFVKYGMARAFNGAVFHTDNGVHEVLFFDPAMSIPNAPGCLVRRPGFAVRVSIDPRTPGVLPDAECTRLVEEADEAFDRLLQRGEGEPSFRVRRLFLMVELPLGPNIDQMAEQLYRSIAGEVRGQRVWWSAQEYEATPHTPARIEVQGEIVLDAPQTEDEVVIALRARYPELTAPLSGSGRSFRKDGEVLRGFIRARHY
jgi:hypothetical protein